MATIPSPVCVTGGNGFIGGWIVEMFLKEGVTVHATVRDPAAAKNKWLIDLGAKYGQGKLKLFAADLEKEDSFDDAVQGCEVVVHVACVVQITYEKDPYKEVINPTLAGVKNIVSACKKHNVRRLVYTSSVATILTPVANRKPEFKDKPYTEDQWNTHATATYGTYKFSKVTAEKWLMENWKGELISLLPSWVVGPQQNNQITSSMQVLRMLINKEKGNKILPRIYLDMVDVRDVASAHVWAAGKKDLPSGRYNITGNRNTNTEELAKALNKIEPKLAIPTNMTPWWLMWCVSWFDKRLTTEFLYEKACPYPAIDNSKIQAAGYTIKYGSAKVDETLKDVFESFKAHGIYKPAPNSA